MRFLGKIILYFFKNMIMIFGVLTALLLIAVLVGFMGGRKDIPHLIKPDTLLVLDLSGGITESADQGILSSYISNSSANNLINVIDLLEHASKEDNIKGLLVNLSTEDITMAQAQELKQAINRFHSKGKSTAIFSDSFGEMGGGNVAYYLATSFDKIWLQPSGQVSLVGFSADVPFFKGIFDKVGVTPRFSKRKDYKTAPESFTETTMSAAHKESMTYLISGLSEQLISDVSIARKIPADQIPSLINQAPFSADSAKKEKLVDEVAYWDEAKAKTLASIAEKAHVLNALDYTPKPDKIAHEAKKVAVIYLDGQISRGSSDTDMNAITSIDSGQTLQEAIDDKSIDGIILRIDSPGGSYVAADSLWRILIQAHEKKKPIVASIASVAASGGYFLAMGADKIIIPPAAFTGSIGVFSGKFVASDLFGKVGLSVDTISVGENANLFSPTRDFTPQQWTKFNQTLDEIYADFTHKVATSRKLNPAKVEELAQGKVWLGRDAVKNGLADAEGGFYDSVNAMRGLLAVTEDEKLNTFIYPAPKSTVERIFSFFGDEPKLLSAENIRGLKVFLNLISTLPFNYFNAGGVLQTPNGDLPKNLN